MNLQKERYTTSMCANASNYEDKHQSDGFEGSYGDPDLPRKKAKLFNRVLRLSHHSDLGRCRENGIQFVKHLLTQRSDQGLLTKLVQTDHLDSTGELLTQLVLYLSKETGTGIRDYQLDFQNMELKASCVHNTHIMMETFMRKGFNINDSEKKERSLFKQ